MVLVLFIASGVEFRPFRLAVSPVERLVEAQVAALA
jgi:hypothetical protein